MKSFSEFPETYDSWIDENEDDDFDADIKSIFDCCPGEMRSRQIERVTPANEVPEFRLQTVRLRKLRS